MILVHTNFNSQLALPSFVYKSLPILQRTVQVLSASTRVPGFSPPDEAFFSLKLLCFNSVSGNFSSLILFLRNVDSSLTIGFHVVIP